MLSGLCKERIFRIILVAALVLSVFFVPGKTRADLSLPTTDCDSAQASAHLVADMSQEDGTRAFSYGSDNNHFASKNGTVITLSINLLFPSTASTNIKINFMDATCTLIAGFAFQPEVIPGQNVFSYDTDLANYVFNDEPATPVLASGSVKYIWAEVLDNFPVATVSSYSYVVDVDDVQNPTGTAPEPTGLRPVLIIPGIMGSELYDGDSLIWMNPTELIADFFSPHNFLTNHLSLDDEGNSINSINSGNIIERYDFAFTHTIIFEGLIQNLENNGYTLDQNLFVFPYDWRLDLDIDRDELNQKILDIKKQTGADKIDIIAHSMGGLITEDYINQFGTSTIDKLIFVGTPHLGAPKAANALLSGDLGTPMSYFINPLEVKSIALNSPSMYELLPNKKYFNRYQGYIKVTSLNKVLDYTDTNIYLFELGKNISLINQAQSFFAKKLEDLDYGDIKVFNIVGCKRASTRDLFTIDDSKRKIVNIQYSNGDGTVPFVSADYSSGTEYYVKDAEHVKLPSMDGVKQLIAGILDGHETLSSNTSTNPNFCPLNGKELNWRSPVSVQIYDSLNNHSGPLSDGTIENNIPGVQYEVIDDEAYIFLPTDEGQTYTIQGTGTANGSFDLIVSDINNDQVTNNTLFDNVRIVLGSSISFNVSQNSDDNNIMVDNSNIFSTINSVDPVQVLTQAINTAPYIPISGSSGGGSGGGSIIAAAPATSDSKKPQDNAKILEKPVSKLRDGTLALDLMDNRTIYMIGSKGKKYGFASEKAFKGLGFGFNQVLTADLNAYELGGLITDPDEIHPNGSLIFDGQTVWLVNNEKRYGFKTMEEFRSYGYDLKQTVPANKNDMLLAITNLIK
ncbi:MAG: hypothetical protein WDN47_01525 [Candidatus Doudnabacteria bacterium]